MNILVSVTKPELELHYTLDLILIKSALLSGHTVYVYVCNGYGKECPNTYDIDSLASGIKELNDWIIRSKEYVNICDICSGRFRNDLAALMEQLSADECSRLEVVEGHLSQSQMANVTNLEVDRVRELIKNGPIEKIASDLIVSSIIPEALGISGATLVDLLDERFESLLRIMLGRATFLHAVFTEIINQKKIDRVFTFNGRFLAGKLLIGLCAERGIGAVSHERGSREGTFLFNPNRSVDDTFRDDVYTLDRMKRDAMSIEDLWESTAELSSNVVKRLQASKLRMAPASNGEVRRKVISYALQSTDEVSICKGLRLDWWDYQFRLGEYLAKRVATEADVEIVFCVHPRSIRSIRLSKSFGGRWSYFVKTIGLLSEQTNGRVRMNFPWLDSDSFACFRNSDTIVTLYSTAAIEASLLGRPLVTHDVSRFSHLGDTVLIGSDVITHTSKIMNLTSNSRGLQEKKRDAVMTYYASYSAPSHSIKGYSYRFTSNGLSVELDINTAARDSQVRSVINNCFQ